MGVGGNGPGEVDGLRGSGGAGSGGGRVGARGEVVRGAEWHRGWQQGSGGESGGSDGGRGGGNLDNLAQATPGGEGPFVVIPAETFCAGLSSVESLFCLILFLRCCCSMAIGSSPLPPNLRCGDCLNAVVR